MYKDLGEEAGRGGAHMGVALALLGEAAAGDPSSGRHPRRLLREGVGRNRECNVVFFPPFLLFDLQGGVGAVTGEV
jgi:hypothetical protein